MKLFSRASIAPNACTPAGGELHGGTEVGVGASLGDSIGCDGEVSGVGGGAWGGEDVDSIGCIGDAHAEGKVVRDLLVGHREQMPRKHQRFDVIPAPRRAAKKKPTLAGDVTDEET